MSSQVLAAPTAENCDVCGGTTARVFRLHDYWIRECSCGHRFAEVLRNANHAERVYGDDYFTGGAGGYPDYLEEAGLITNQGRFYGRLLAKYLKPGRVLDVGAAAGFILRGLVEHGWQGIGLEPNGRMAARARESGLDVRQGTIENFRHQGKFDLVNMTQVVPHFHNLRAALDVARNLTVSRGHWLIETWNKDSWFARVQGKHWHEYRPPSSLHDFSLDTLTTLVGQFGFERIAHGRPPKRISLRHATALVAHKLGSPNDAWTSRLDDSVPELRPDVGTVPVARLGCQLSTSRQRTSLDAARPSLATCVDNTISNTE